MGPGPQSPESTSKAKHVLVIPEMGRQRQESPWGSLADQPGLLVSCRPVRDYLG